MLSCAHCGGDNPAGARFCNNCGRPLAVVPGTSEQRKTVTILFCDVTGSTALGEAMDPEALRTLLARYFERMKAIVELHGGTVEKFIGDAVMAVFGVPAVHEDDALRACRAALEMQAAFPELSIAGRIGITTGEIVTGTAERLATGDAVNVAARLEQAAAAGEILVGVETVRLARASIEVEQVRPLDLKGKAQPVPAFRLLGATATTRPQRSHTPFVGRTRELSTLRAAWERACAERRCELVTVVGAAGVGKSRLAAELLAGVGGRVARGRCLPYGEGITYWPVLEVLAELADVEVEPRVAEALSPTAGSRQITASEQIPWAVRKVLEAAAEVEPLAVLFDDIQWAEEGFLDVVEHVALLSLGHPILLLCLARPELQDVRPDWPGTMRLEPLGSDESARLIADHLGGRELAADMRDRIVTASGGNPLFVEEMIAMLDDAAGEVAVPPTIQALLAARLDQLELGERRVLERAAVEGEIFHLGALRTLLDEEPNITARITSLVRKELIHPGATQVPGDDAFRFRHLLLRDAAYEFLAKSARAELHQRYAAWLEQVPTEVAETEELAGYHLERAHEYLVQLGASDAESAVVGDAAAQRIESAGRRALARGDLHAAANLLSRAWLLRGDDPRRLQLVPDLAASLRHLGQLQRADELLATAASDDALVRDSPLDVALRFEHLAVRYFLEAEGVTPRILAEARRMLPILEADGADALLAGALEVVALARLMQCDFVEMRTALEQALVHARRAGKERDATEILLWIPLSLHHGPAPVAEGIARCDEILADPATSDLAEAGALAASGLLTAMNGDLAGGRARMIRARDLFEEWGIYVDGSASALAHCVLELLAGDPAAAVHATQPSYDQLLRLGERAYLSTLGGAHALALARAGRYAEARAAAENARRATATEDVGSNILWRVSTALVSAAGGDGDAALRSADEAIALVEPTDAYLWRVFALETRADVFRELGRASDAEPALEQALALHLQKGDVLSSKRLASRL